MIIAPSLLAAQFFAARQETARIQRSGADGFISISWMTFVPNISFGPAVCPRHSSVSKMIFDVHLMCSRPEILLEPFAKAGADRMTVHVELDGQVTPLIWKIRSLGKQVGLAINRRQQ